MIAACQSSPGDHVINNSRKDSVSGQVKIPTPVPGSVHLKFSRHARCRMDCRHITEHEIEEVLEHGVENMHSTELHAEDKRGRCPKYALEANTDEGQHLRVVFAYCDGDINATVVTCIDLNKEWQCDCH